MKKEINEKTFELNITHELLCRPINWFIERHFLFRGLIKSDLKKKNEILKYLHTIKFYSLGLTQDEESSPGGGYDVSININDSSVVDKRLLMLQYKSGIHIEYSTLNNSIFTKSNPPSEHIKFKINDAAKNEQHIILRKLSKSKGINRNSIMYVFPRITNRTDFQSKIGKLVEYSSFVPVREIDRQASKKGIIIKKGDIHHYRTSYNGLKSEVNSEPSDFEYDDSYKYKLIAELICIRIERIVRFVVKSNERDKDNLKYILDDLIDYNQFIYYNFENTQTEIIRNKVKSYIKSLSENLNSNREITKAPSEFTTILPKGGIKLNFEEKYDLSSINYQIF